MNADEITQRPSFSLVGRGITVVLAAMLLSAACANSEQPVVPDSVGQTEYQRCMREYDVSDVSQGVIGHLIAHSACRANVREKP